MRIIRMKEMNEVQEKWVTILYGTGTERRVPESALPKVKESSEYMKSIARRPGSIISPEEADKMFSYRIVRDEN